MAWNEFLEASGIDREVTDEIQKDVTRLSVIADRFSKIGSKPELKARISERDCGAGSHIHEKPHIRQGAHLHGLQRG